MDNTTRLGRISPVRWAAVALLVATVGAVGRFSMVQTPATHAATVCQIGGPTGAVKHVIYIQFDNFHFTRDNPNVPSDLEQTPSLLNFITSNGTLLTDHHTPLISHTADDFLTSFTGNYGARHGMPISNSYRYFNPDGTSSSAGSFQYWTDTIGSTNAASPDPDYNMTNQAGLNTSAPWVPYTRAGCDFGAVGGANLGVENTNHDVAALYGPNSPEAKEAQGLLPGDAFADFLGIAVHCAQADPLCSTANHGQPDLLPSEPFGYTGYQALFGHKYVAPLINPNPAAGVNLNDLDGNPIQDVFGGQANPGFPGFDKLTPSVSLAYLADMQEHGIPVTYAYITNAHNNLGSGPIAFGPGEAGYEAQLKAFDKGFSEFFARLAADGINKSNTLFVFTSDENDHFAGGGPSPANCNGVTVPCTYAHVGEIGGNLNGLVFNQSGITTPFQVRTDVAPTIYVDNHAPLVNLNGAPNPVDSTTLSLAQSLGQLVVPNPIQGGNSTLVKRMADPLEMKILHMLTSDGARTPNLNLFLNADYYVGGGAVNGCPNNSCVTEQQGGFAYNHGSYQPEITTTWLGLVGPGVEVRGTRGATFTDEVDIRPTMLALLGMQDDYVHDGRVITEILDSSVLPADLRGQRAFLHTLGKFYKQIDAPLGPLGLDTLALTTSALKSGNSATYAGTESFLESVLSQRDTIANALQPLLDWTEPHGSGAFASASTLSSRAPSLLQSAQNLLEQVHARVPNS